MKHTMRRQLRRGLLALGLSLLGACGGGDGGLGAGGGGTHNFDSGTGFNGAVSRIRLALDGSGDAYVTGSFTQYDGKTANGMARLNRDGSLDAGFDAGAGFDVPPGAIEPIGDGTGDVYAAGGFSSYRGNPAPYIVRISPDGTKAPVDFGSGFDLPVNALAMNAGLDDLYAAGGFTQFRQNPRAHLARVNPDGSNDDGFDPGSSILTCCTIVALAVARDGTGSLYAGGEFLSYRGNARHSIVRIHPDGSNDGGFEPGAAVEGLVFDVAPAIDGSNDVYLGGRFDMYQGDDRNDIVRIHPDGSDDAGFDPGTGFAVSSGSSDVLCIANANDGSGDIYVGGHFASYDGSRAANIARLNRNGSLDAGFVTGSGFNGDVETIAAATDGSGDVLVAGEFTRYKGRTVGHIVRLNPDGSLD